MSRARNRGRLVAMASAGLAAVALVLALSAVGALRRVELDSVDARFAVRGERPLPGVVLVAIDDITFSELGEQWPFPRRLHARAIDRLGAAGVRAIAYDVQFTEATNPRDDLALYDAVARTGGVVLGTTEVDDRGGTNVLGGDDNLRAAGARAANTMLPLDEDGVMRRMSARVDGLVGFPLAAAEAAAGPIAPPPGGDAWIDFRGPPGSVSTVSFSRLVDGRVPARELRGRIAVVGASAPSLHDVHRSATSGDELMAGPELHANAIVTALEGFPLRSAPGWLPSAAVVLLGLLAPLAGVRLSATRTALVASALLAGWVVAVQAAFERGLVLPFAAPALALVLAAVSALAAGALLEASERRRTRALFGRFVGEQVANELLEREALGARLGGVRQTATVLFCDLRGFTAFAESLPAERVIEVLNRYLTEMSDAILDHGGTLVSYMGDGIMAVFGAPIERADHADAALAAAREMASERLARFNAWVTAEGLGDGFDIGIGLNSGPVMSGNVGSERRLEYAAVGDTTNVAARVETLAKDLPYRVVVSGSTRAALAVDDASLVPLGAVELSGRRTAIVVWGCEPQPLRRKSSSADIGPLKDRRPLSMSQVRP